MAGVKDVFPTAEHRECMLHLVKNFKKRYSGQIFEENLWPAAYSWSPYFFEKHWKLMEEAVPESMDYKGKTIPRYGQKVNSQLIARLTISQITWQSVLTIG